MARRRGSTEAVHGGEEIDPVTGSVVTPIHQTSTFAYPELAVDGKWKPATWAYTRYANPTIAAAEAKVATLEKAGRSLLFSTGMAAVAASIFPFVQPGARVATMAGIYGGTQALLRRQVSRLGVDVDSSLELDASALAEAASESTRVFVTEVPTNPFNRVIDLETLSSKLRSRWGRRRPVLVTDATIATPLNLRPLEHGADLSVHSATKYLGGHTDLLGGVVSGQPGRLEGVETWRRDVGASADPHQAFLIQRGVKTLEVRLRRAEANARTVAEMLEGHRRVDQVWFPGLPSHPDHKLARRLLRGPGALVTFRLGKARAAAARRVRRSLALFAPAPSFGGVESLVSLPIETSHASATPAERRAQGITPDLVRLAIGIEDADDLVEDVRGALRSV